MTDVAVARSGGLMRQALQAPPECEEVEPFRASHGYSVEDLTLVLATIYMNGGNMRAAERQLDAQGVRNSRGNPIPRGTMQEWMEKHPMRYAHVGRIFRDVAEEKIVVKLRENIMAAVEASTMALHLEVERIQAGDVKDAAAAAQRLATVAGISTDKMLSLTGRPQQISQHRSGQEILRQLESIGQAAFVDGSAEEG